MKFGREKQATDEKNDTAPKRRLGKKIFIVMLCLFVMAVGGVAGAYFGGFIKLNEATVAKMAELPLVGNLLAEKFKVAKPVAAKPKGDSQTKINNLKDDNRYLRDQLRQKEAELQDKEDELKALQGGTEQQTGEAGGFGQSSSTTDTTGTAGTTGASATVDPRVKSLVKTYAAMKADAAAKIMSQQNDTLTIEILTAMKADEAAAILSKMDPQRAAQLTTKMRNR